MNCCPLTVAITRPLCNAQVCAVGIEELSTWTSRHPETVPTRRAKDTFPLQHTGEPEEVVCPVLYFAGPAATFTTGTIMTIDGGSFHRILRTTYE